MINDASEEKRAKWLACKDIGLFLSVRIPGHGRHEG
jgi:hypothetical protein